MPRDVALQCLCCQSDPKSGVATLLPHCQTLQEKDGGVEFEMFAETEILPDDCLPHESNGTLSGPQSGGTMRHKIDVLFEMQRRKVATTYDTRSEETWIEDDERRHEVRAENARRVAEENEKIQRRFREE